MENLVELTYDESVDANGGIAAGAIAIGLLGFGCGVVIGCAVAYGIYCVAQNFK